MAKVLITSEYFCKFDSYAKQMLLEKGHEVIDNPYGHQFLTPEEIIPFIGEADAVIADLEKYTEEVISVATNLKLIARRGVGLDSVDLEACRKRGITVVKALNAVEAPVAELVMAYILEFSRKIIPLNSEMHAGRWNKIPGNSLFQKTLGIVGMGNIAREVVKRAKAFDMKIVYFDAFRKSAQEEEELGISYLSLEELFALSDFISLHMPLTEETRHMVGYELLKKMKPTAYLINTARGGVVNIRDLKRALDEKKLAGAGIDVFEEEPTTDCILNGCENCLLTPHVATFTRETFIQMDRICAENINRFFEKR